jgi:hypothetical protein
VAALSTDSTLIRTVQKITTHLFSVQLRGIELDAADIIGGMAGSVDHWIPPFAG